MSETIINGIIEESQEIAGQMQYGRGAKGDDGVGISDISKTSTEGKVDTYTITLTDGTTKTFTVTNGISVSNAAINASGHLIVTFSDGTSVDAGVAKGDTGDSGVYIGTTPPTDPSIKVWIDTSGEAGDVEMTSNKVTSISSESTDTQYPSAKAVSEAILRATNYERYFEIIDEYYTATKSRKAIVLKPQYRGATVDFSQDTSIVEGIPNTYLLNYCTTNSTSDNGIGAEGSNINSLPEVLYIPETINGETYMELGYGMFAYNKRVKEVILPKTINQIPAECFAFTTNLEKVLNSEIAQSIQFGGFFASGIKEINFPDLVVLDKKAFMKCGHLTKINIGKVTAIGDRCFEHCTDLQEITHDSDTIITTVGNGAFFNTTALKEVDFISTLTSIGDFAFSCCALNFDWSTLSGCTFGNYATPLQMNPTLTSDSYNIKTTSCQLNAPLRIDQENPKWADKPINALETEYKMGCAYFSVMNAYCGILGLNYDNPRELEHINKAIPITVEEVETMVDISSMDKNEVYNNYYGNIVKYIGATDDNYTQNHYYRAGRDKTVYIWYNIGTEIPTNIDLFMGNTGVKCWKDWINGLGLISADSVKITPTEYPNIIEALQNGSYVVLNIPAGWQKGNGHAIILYGVNSNGEVLFVNSSVPSRNAIEDYTAVTGSCLLQNLTYSANVSENGSFYQGSYNVISEGTTKTLLNKTVGNINAILEELL